MAASTLPAPGKKIEHGPDKGMEIGPCTTVCDHKDCALIRQQAEAGCAICGEKIGYETAYYTMNREDSKRWYGSEITPWGTMIKFMTDGPRSFQLVHATCYEKKIREERESA